MSSPEYRLGVDVGGTFTDFVLLDIATGSAARHKVLTTPDDPARAIEDGTRELLTQIGLSGGTLARVVHGTTLATNALIQRTGAPTGLLTTRGFGDLLEMGTEQRYDIHDLFLRFPEPLVPRHARLEVDERLAADGSVVRPLDEAQARRQAEHLAELGLRSVAIVLLHSYANPAHELAVERIVREVMPDAITAVSHRVAPELREYERASTTAANAYIAPVVGSYLNDLGRRLERLGAPARYYVMCSDGGSIAAEVAAEVPVRILESGPAGGVLAAARYARRAGLSHVLSFDMGGTTAKACLIRNGRPERVAVLEVARVHRFKPGSGLPIRAPALDLLEVGAGGGSIARVDRLGLLKVGPDSAGASPGPACYGLGGSEPTVTDAALVLGYLSPEAFLGGRLTLDLGAARRAIGDRIARPLGLSLEQAAWGIYSVVSESMALVARMHVVEHGADPRACVLYAFGGAGPVHASRIASILGIGRVVCPLGAGVASALGFLVAPLSFSESRSLPELLREIDTERLGAALGEMEERARLRVRTAGVLDREIVVTRRADLSLLGQSHEISVGVPEGVLDRRALLALEESFAAEYGRRYAHPPMPGVPVQAVTWRVEVGEREHELAERGGDATVATAAARTHRQAYFPEHGGYLEIPIYERTSLAPGSRLAGPAVVEEVEATTVIGPGWEAGVDAHGDLLIEPCRDPAEGRH